MKNFPQKCLFAFQHPIETWAYVARPWFKWLSNEKPTDNLIRLGTRYGGWWVPQSAIEAGKTAICAGAGEDISFDVALAKQGMHVCIIDPTPRAKQHIENVLAAIASQKMMLTCENEVYDLANVPIKNLKHMHKGLWRENTTLKFYVPTNSEHVSHSATNLHGTSDYFEAECLSYEGLLKEIAIDHKDVSCVKLDIEGAEYAVLSNMLATNQLPSVLCVEFDEGYKPKGPLFVWRVWQHVRQLRQSGYRLAKAEGWNGCFVNEG